MNGRSNISLVGNTTYGINCGGGAEIFKCKDGGNLLLFRTICAAGTVSIITGATFITISGTSDYDITGATNLGSGNGTLYENVTSRKINLKSLSGGSNVNITCNGNYVVINANDISGIEWSGSTVNGMGTYIDGNTICSQPNLTFDGTKLNISGNLYASSCVRSLIISGATISASTCFCGTINCAVNSDTLDGQHGSHYAISASAVTGATNLGGGDGSIYTSVSDNKINLKSLSGGTNVTLTCNGNYIAINAAGSTVPITGATNGLSVVNKNVGLGGTLTGHTTINANSKDFCIYNARTIILNSTGYTNSTFYGYNSYFCGSNSGLVCSPQINIYFSTSGSIYDTSLLPRGIQYGDDYSSTFCNNSLVTKKYVCSQISGITGSVLITGATNGLGVTDKKVCLGGVLLNTTNITGVYTLNICDGAKLNSDCGYQISGITMLRNSAIESTSVYLGYCAGSNGSGNDNFGVNWLSLQNNTTGYSNIGIGNNALNKNTTGRDNIALGLATLYANTGGTLNIAIGCLTMCKNISGSDNVAIGSGALFCNVTGSSNVAIGRCAGFYETGSSKLYIGNCITNPLIYGEFDTKMVKVCGCLCITNLPIKSSETCGIYIDAAGKLSTGIIGGGITGATSLGTATAVYAGVNACKLCFKSISGGTGISLSNTANAITICSTVSGGIGWSNYSGSTVAGCGTVVSGATICNNTFYGVEAGKCITTGFGNVGIGTFALNNNTCGSNNIAIGINALYWNISGSTNVANGCGALYCNTWGCHNIAIGGSALHQNTIGCHNIANGLNALYFNISGCHNIANGCQALNANISGCHNIANGNLALMGNTSGCYNIANGSQALLSNTSGNSNIANGLNALYANTCGNNNIANGQQALATNICGCDNIADGYQALNNNTTGCTNIAIGNSALIRNVGGCENTAIGCKALYCNTYGKNNIAIGSCALYSNCTGCNNIANGNAALAKNTTACDNIANGNAALGSNITGRNNIANGFNSLYFNTTGCDNIANGFQTLLYNCTGNNNIANGCMALLCNCSGGNNIANGYTALCCNRTGSNNIANGYQALFKNVSGDSNIANGASTLQNNKSGCFNIANGQSALYSNISGHHNIATGLGALYCNTCGCHNIAIGCGTLYWNISGCTNVAIGLEALCNNIKGCGNVAFGTQALTTNTCGTSNTALGANTLYLNTSGNQNIAVGFQSLFSNTIGCDNVAVGTMVLATNSKGHCNIALGYQTLYLNTSGCTNVAIGQQALCNNTIGSNNIAIGYQTGFSGITGSLNVFLGYEAGYREKSSNKLYIANSKDCSLIYGDFATCRLVISGTTEIVNSAGCNYFYLGNKDTDGSWRFVVSGASLVVQVRTASIWGGNKIVAP
jgi:hypothetical protein